MAVVVMPFCVRLPRRWRKLPRHLDVAAAVAIIVIPSAGFARCAAPVST